MGNYQFRGILVALPRNAPARHLRLLTALATITADSDGWRHAGVSLLADYAQLSQPTARRARDELLTAGLIKYEKTGQGRGTVCRWQLLVAERQPGKGTPWVSPSGGQKCETPRPLM
jgi:hypothetical protein